MVATTLNNLFEWNGSIFDDIVIPEGAVKEDLVATIYRRCFDNFVQFSEWGQCKSLSDAWFHSHLEDFTRLYKSYTAIYDVLEDVYMSRTYSENRDVTGNGGSTRTGNTNEDRTQSEEVTGNTVKDWNENDTDLMTGNGSVTYGKKEVTSENSSSTTGGEHKVAPYNANTYVNTDKNDGTATAELSRTLTHSGKDDNTKSENHDIEKSGKDTVTDTKTGTLENKGNVSTSEEVKRNEKRDENMSGQWVESGRRGNTADQILKNLEIGRFNFYEHVADLWEVAFTITVY